MNHLTGRSMPGRPATEGSLDRLLEAGDRALQEIFRWHVGGEAERFLLRLTRVDDAAPVFGGARRSRGGCLQRLLRSRMGALAEQRAAYLRSEGGPLLSGLSHSAAISVSALSTALSNAVLASPSSTAYLSMSTRW